MVFCGIVTWCRYDARIVELALEKADDDGLMPLDVLAFNTSITVDKAEAILWEVQHAFPDVIGMNMVVHHAAHHGNIAVLNAILKVDTGAWCKRAAPKGHIPLATALLARKWQAAEAIVQREVPRPDMYVRLLRRHPWAHALIATAVQANPTRLHNVWPHVPPKCRGLHKAIPAVMAHAPEALGTLVSLMDSQADKEVVCALWALERNETVLPVDMRKRILSLVFR